MASKSGRYEELPGRVVARIEQEVVKTDDGCWLLQERRPNNAGYVNIGWCNGIDPFPYIQAAHEVMARVYLNGGEPIHPDMEVHHICRVRNCVNPEHLRIIPKEDHRNRHHRSWTRLPGWFRRRLSIPRGPFPTEQGA